MKKLIASAGLVAVGTAGLHAENLTGVPQTAKFWTLSASLRGFYDDNTLTTPSSSAANPEESFGFEVNPSIKFSFPGEQTTVNFGYNYSLRYYFTRGDNSPDDQSHEITAELDHRFSPQQQINFQNAFVYAQEPDVIETSGIISAPGRTDSSAFRNHAAIRYDINLTRLLALRSVYDNSWYDYEQEGPGSRSALLDRMEHVLGLDLRWMMRESFSPLVGYQYAIRDYTSDESISTAFDTPGDSRDNTAHYVYVGAIARFGPRLYADGRVGANFTSYADSQANDQVSPYAMVSGNYEYLPGSKVQVGLRHDRSATDIPGTTSGSVTYDQESTSIYATISHRVTPQLTANLLAQMQYGTFTGGGGGAGGIENSSDNLYLLGLSAEYRFTRSISGEAGYNLDRLDSSLPDRSYTRNRVYLGVRVTY